MLENALADYACESRCVPVLEKNISLIANALQTAALEVGTVVADLIDALYPAPSRPGSAEDTNMEDRDDPSPLINEDVARSLWKAVVSMSEKTMAPVRDTLPTEIFPLLIHFTFPSLAGVGPLEAVHGMGRSYCFGET